MIDASFCDWLENDLVSDHDQTVDDARSNNPVFNNNDRSVVNDDHQLIIGTDAGHRHTYDQLTVEGGQSDIRSELCQDVLSEPITQPQSPCDKELSTNNCERLPKNCGILSSNNANLINHFKNNIFDDNSSLGDRRKCVQVVDIEMERGTMQCRDDSHVARDVNVVLCGHHGDVVMYSDCLQFEESGEYNFRGTRKNVFTRSGSDPELSEPDCDCFLECLDLTELSERFALNKNVNSNQDEATADFSRNKSFIIRDRNSIKDSNLASPANTNFNREIYNTNKSNILPGLTNRSTNAGDVGLRQMHHLTSHTNTNLTTNNKPSRSKRPIIKDASQGDSSTQSKGSDDRSSEFDQVSQARRQWRSACVDGILRKRLRMKRQVDAMLTWSLVHVVVLLVLLVLAMACPCLFETMFPCFGGINCRKPPVVVKKSFWE